MARASGKNVKVWLAVIGLSGVLAFVVPALADKAAQWAITRLLAEGFDLTVSIERMNLQWWPLAVEMQGVDVVHPRVHPVRFSRVQAEIDPGALAEGVLTVPVMHIDGVTLGRLAIPVDSARGVVASTAASRAFPEMGPLPMQALIEAESRRYDEQFRVFRAELQQKQETWSQQLQRLPAAAELAAHQARLRERSHSGAALASGDDPRLLLESDLARFAEVDNALRNDWQRFQARYLGLRALADQSVERILQERGVSDAQLAVLGQGLVHDTLYDWFERGLGFHQVLAGHEGEGLPTTAEPPVLRLLVRKALFGGEFVHGARRGEVSGEMLNLSNAPIRLAEPLTLHIEVHGKGIGDLQLSVLLDHRAPGREADHFNFSLQNSPFPRFVLAENPALAIDLRNTLLSVDMAGTIGHQGTLDLSLSSVFNTQSLEVRVKSADNPLANALAPALTPVRKVMLAGAVKGSLARPEMQASTSLDEVIAPVARALVERQLPGQKAQLLTQLEAVLQQHLATLESDLARSSALLDVARQRAEPFERLRYTLTRRVP